MSGLDIPEIDRARDQSLIENPRPRPRSFADYKIKRRCLLHISLYSPFPPMYIGEIVSLLSPESPRYIRFGKTGSRHPKPPSAPDRQAVQRGRIFGGVYVFCCAISTDVRMQNSRG